MQKRVIWDLTYACPLRCLHCYSESGRRPITTISESDMEKIVKVIVQVNPVAISISGGEPLVVPWWRDALKILKSHNIPITVFTSGWLMNHEIATDLASLADKVSVSIDGADAGTHDLVRGREGSYAQTQKTLKYLHDVKEQRSAANLPCYSFGVDQTVTKISLPKIRDFISNTTETFPLIDYVRLGAVVPEGLAQEQMFVEKYLLSDDEVAELTNCADELKELSRCAAEISVTDARYFLPTSHLSKDADMIAHIEPDGQLRAFTTYEAKVGNVLETEFEELWQRALDWREDRFVSMLRNSIKSVSDWAHVTRILDRAYGSVDDRIRLAKRA